MTDVTLRGKDIVATPIQRLIISTDAIDKIRFSVPRHWGGHDLSTADWIMKFELPSGEKNGVALEISPFDTNATVLEIIWDPSGLATSESGRMRIQMQADLVEGSDLHVWQSKVTPITVDVTIPIDEVVPETQSYLESFLIQITSLSQTTITARNQAEAFAIAAGISEANASGSETAASNAAGAAGQSEANAEEYKDTAYSAKVDAELARAMSENAANNAIALFGDLGTIEGLVTDAEGYASDALRDKNLAETAKGQSEDARDRAETAKTDVLAIYGSAQAVADAQAAAETAQGKAESARDEILDDAGFIGVVANLSVINDVYANRSNINSVNANKINIDKVADNIDEVAAVGTNIHYVVDVSRNKDNIDSVAGGLSQIIDLQEDMDAINGIYTNLDELLVIPGKADEAAVTLAGIDDALAVLDDYTDTKERAEAAADAVEAIGYGPIKSIKRKIRKFTQLWKTDEIYYGIDEMLIEEGVTVEINSDCTLVIV